MVGAIIPHVELLLLLGTALCTLGSQQIAAANWSAFAGWSKSHLQVESEAESMMSLRRGPPSRGGLAATTLPRWDGQIACHSIAADRIDSIITGHGIVTSRWPIWRAFQRGSPQLCLSSNPSQVLMSHDLIVAEHRGCCANCWWLEG